MGHHPLPAMPLTVAAFIGDHGGLTPDLLFAEVAAIDEQHQALGYAPPGRSDVALKAFDAVHPTRPPRSWRKEEQEMFLMLPWGIKQTILRREAERDRAIKHAQSEVSELRQKIGKENGDHQDAAA
ncbi:hypothetical protein CK489_27700 [Bradyrhizobium sp. UFLA03-84]|nr:hypothetical protein CK489_27700 [Bradyrhizobium sp. UFLA03-84]